MPGSEVVVKMKCGGDVEKKNRPFVRERLLFSHSYYVRTWNRLNETIKDKRMLLPLFYQWVVDLSAQSNSQTGSREEWSEIPCMRRKLISTDLSALAQGHTGTSYLLEPHDLLEKKVVYCQIGWFNLPVRTPTFQCKEPASSNRTPAKRQRSKHLTGI